MAETILYNEVPRSIESVKRAQRVRLYADGLMGIYLMSMATQGRITNFGRFALGAFAIGTIFFNLRNYIEYQKLKQNG